LTTNTAFAWSWSPPAGMNFYIVDIYVAALGVASDPSLTVGLTKGATHVVSAVNVTTNLGALTLKTNLVTSGNILDVRVTNDANDSADSVSVTITGYVSAAPTSVRR
jgi:hypothetical protein